MRRENLAILLALPVANALSLANFQEITSVLIPLSCQLTYDSQIPQCTKSDFQNGCSTSCVSGLNTIAQEVSDSCALVSVSPSTLLGIVKNGGIVAALCPTLARTTSVLKSSTAPIAATASPAVSVTIPTNSQGNTGGLGLKTTSTSSTSIPPTQSIVSSRTSSVSGTVKSISATKTTSTSTSTISSLSSSSLYSSSSTESADGGIGGGGATSTTTTSSTSSKKDSIATSTTAATSKPAAQPNAGTGGGSPFDIASGASKSGGDSILGLVILVMACVLTGW